MEDSVAVALQHLGVDVEAGVSQLSDLLGQQLHPIHRVAEDDGLVDLQLQPDTNTQSNDRNCAANWSWHNHMYEQTRCHKGCGDRALHTLEKSVFRQWIFCLSSTKA